jgi:hypothetical protein
MKNFFGTLTLIVILVGVFATFFLHAYTVEAGDDACFQVQASQWGKSCGEDPSALEITLKNVCSKKMSLIYCLDQEGGKRDCRIKANISGGDLFKVSACKATGNYEFTACEKTRDCKKELKKKIGK